MSKALRCDKCGTFYEPYGAGRKGFNSVSITAKNQLGTYDAVKIYDLCPECMEELLDSMNMNEKGEKKTNDERRACDREPV